MRQLTGTTNDDMYAVSVGFVHSICARFSLKTPFELKGQLKGFTLQGQNSSVARLW